jgi:hypothetical protein
MASPIGSNNPSRKSNSTGIPYEITQPGLFARPALIFSQGVFDCPIRVIKHIEFNRESAKSTKKTK